MKLGDNISLARHPGESRDPVTLLSTPEGRWIPAFAGMTSKKELPI